MTAMDLLETIGCIKDSYVLEAHSAQKTKKKSVSLRRMLLIAAMIALMLLLVGCCVAYVNGWFTDVFSARSETPLSEHQIQYIEENEQIIQQPQEKNGWTVELKSTMCDGEIGYIMFGITAPEGVDLEANLTITSADDPFITPGNNSWNPQGRRCLTVASNGPADPDLNYIWQEGGHWEADNDGLANTLNYLVQIRCEKLYPERERLLKDPFGSDVEFNVRFDDFTLEYIDQAVQESLEAKYAGQEAYMIDGEELAGLHKSDILVEGEWEFTIVFGVDGEKAESIELISEPVMVEAQVYRKVGDDPIFYDVSHDLEQIKLTSFVLKPLGAELMFEQEEDVTGAFFEWQNDYWYGNRDIFVVMKDGSQIALHTAFVGTKLTAETPIVLGEVEYILMGDGTKLDRPEHG
ncbi:MAG: DUF4179 domain-containing protein [Faecousia sp.]